MNIIQYINVTAIVKFLNQLLLSSTMAGDKISMPSGMGGLVRYFDEYKSKIEFKPGHIIVLCVIVMALMVFLYAYGNALLGL